MKNGDIVEIFFDPVTKQKSEGKAKIEFIHYEDDEEIRADVRFLGTEDEGYFYRRIMKR